MGCDIHAYVERKEKTSKSWQPFGGQLRLERNYGMFGKIAGVRVQEEPVTPLKGLPIDMAWEAEHDAFLTINDRYADSDGYTSLERALQYQTYGETIQMSDGKPWRVTHPDWHSRTWLTSEEFQRAIEAYEAQYTHEPKRWHIDYRAALAAMREFEHYGEDTRIVIWFDN